MPMRPDNRRALATAVLALLSLLRPSAALAEESLRCRGALVRVGGARSDLVAHCGEPAFREPIPSEAGVIVLGGALPWVVERAVSESVERWSYNFGPRRFVYYVTLRGGRISEIEHGGYGYDPAVLAGAGPRAVDCGAATLRIGERTLDLVAKCGDPVSLERRAERRAITFAPAPATAVSEYRTVDVAVWTFDPGPGRLTVVATLEDGVIVDVRSGGYGASR